MIEGELSASAYAMHWGVWLARDFIEQDTIDNPWDERLVQLCGHCGHPIKAFQSGWSGVSDSFREVLCPNCDSACFRDCTIVAVRSVEAEWDKIDVRNYIKARADVSFWRGGIVPDSSIDNTVAFMNETDQGIASHRRQSMIQVVDWRARCPACLASPDDVDFHFHHWDYNTDQGVQLCENCHNHIHRHRTASEQASLEYIDDWQEDAANRLLSHARSNGVSCTFAHVRFNIPTEIVRSIDEGGVLGNDTSDGVGKVVYGRDFAP